MTWQTAPGDTVVMIAPVSNWIRPVSKQSTNTGRNRTIEGQYTDLWDEATCIERARQGDQAAFAEIYQHFERPIYGLIYRLMGNSEDAFDITQDVFVKAYKALARTSPDLNLSAWLHRIASNTCLDVLRRRKIVRWLPWDPTEHANITRASESDEPERRLMGEETRLQVQAVLNQMNERYRLCLILREYQELSCEEISEIMSTSRQAVKSMLFRARDQFREIYERQQAAQLELGKNSLSAQPAAKTKEKKGGRR
ncbi:MAG: polymerase subunit sigma-24 [Chloroflexi bacterium]|nr:polymerase subunit sigma-24 [Chloroflexota bacterium]